jgi:hypothetical protein
MLGLYENFPKTVHKTAFFATLISNKRLQQALIQTFQKMNNENFNLENISNPSMSQCTAILQFGIAEANNFNYLDDEEANKVQEVVQKKPLQVMDFFCAFRYYKMQNGKKTPLRFDYYMMRFIFDNDSMEIQIFHERGPRYMSPEDAVNFVINKVNETFSKKILKAVKPL